MKQIWLLTLLVLLPAVFTAKVAKEDSLVIMRGFCDGLDIDADVKPEAFAQGDDIADVITLLSAENRKFAMNGLKKLGSTLGKIHSLITNKGGNKGADDLYLEKIKGLATDLEAIDAYEPGDNNNLTIKGVSIVELVNNATLSLNSGDYYNAGFSMGACLANVFTATEPPMSEEVLAEVQAKAEEKGWTPGDVPEEMAEIGSIDDLRHKMLGIPDQFYSSLINEARRRRRAGILPEPIYDHTRASYPAEFDARTQWPKCVFPVRHQGTCGSCWAFAGTTALSYRFCIASGAKTKKVLSPQHMLECEKTSFGCQGGFHYYLNKYVQEKGIYQESCFAYASGPSAKLLNQCPAKCKDNSTPNKLFTSKTITLQNNENDIKKELMTNGPMATSFTVYQDFMSYKGGVYSHVSGGKAGGHAVVLLGWGTDKKTNKQYWLMQNSWGSGWGEQGFFKIRFGDSDINSQVTGGLPDMAKSVTNYKNGADMPAENGGGNSGGAEFNKKKNEPEPEPEYSDDEDWGNEDNGGGSDWESEFGDDDWRRTAKSVRKAEKQEEMETIARVLRHADVKRASVRKTAKRHTHRLRNHN